MLFLTIRNLHRYFKSIYVQQILIILKGYNYNYIIIHNLKEL